MPDYKLSIELDAEGNAAVNIGKLDDAAGSLNQTMGKASGSAGGLGAALGGLVNPTNLALGGLAALGGAVIATGAKAIDLSNQVQDATAHATGVLALSAEEAADFDRVLQNIYAANYGESFEDIGTSLETVSQQLQRIGGAETPQQLEEITTQALTLRDAFEYDVGSSVSAVSTLMENFGLTSQQAFDFIVAGQQRGLDASGDFLDTIGEYSVQFSQGGASAAEFFSILESGNQGGVLGTDKVADAFKEFNIRIVDDSATTKTALESIGISYDELKQGFADGSITQVQAMQTVIAKINEIEDPVKRNTAGVALFGTQWEDLSEQVLSSVDTQITGLEDLEGAADSLAKQYETSGAEWDAVNREWEAALVDIGDALKELGVEVLPWLADQARTFLIPTVELLANFLHNLQEGQNAWDSFINGLWGMRELPPASWNGGDATPDPQAEGSSVGRAQAQASIVQQFFIDRGDPEIVQAAASMGLNESLLLKGV